MCYIIEATTNLVVPIPWQSIGADTSDAGGVIQFTDSDATNFLMRFYRVVSP